jgi:hypothetical protein
MKTITLSKLTKSIVALEGTATILTKGGSLIDVYAEGKNYGVRLRFNGHVFVFPSISEVKYFISCYK